MLLGAGRARVDSAIDPAVGDAPAQEGRRSGRRRGKPLCTLLVNDESRLAEVTTLVAEAYSLADGELTVPERFSSD